MRGVEAAPRSDDQALVWHPSTAGEHDFAVVGVDGDDRRLATLLDAQALGDVAPLPVQGVLPAGEEMVGHRRRRVRRERLR